MICGGGFRRVLGQAGVATLAVLLILSIPGTAQAAPADLDPSFGQGGYAIVQANAACIQGCVELAGSYADALALQPNGGIVLGGSNGYIGARSGFPHVPGALVRLQSDGTLDNGFGGTGGIVDAPFGVTEVRANARGGLVVSGTAESGRAGIQRYTPDGILDGFYGSHGVKWLAGVEPGMRDRRGRYLAFVTIAVPPTYTEGGTTRLDVRRRLTSGKRDAGFGFRGYTPLPHSRGASPLALAAMPDGGLIAAFAPKRKTSSDLSSLILFEHVTPDGKLDRAFGEHGVAHLQLPGEVDDVTMATRDGRVFLAVGEQRETKILGGDEILVLAKYTAAGQLDRYFGDAGLARSKLTSSARYRGISPRAITFDARGDLIVVGEHRIRAVDTLAGDGFVARYTPQGRDCSFGSGGLAIDRNLGTANAVAVQRDGRIIVVGGLGRFLAARFMGGGSPRACRISRGGVRGGYASPGRPTRTG